MCSQLVSWKKKERISAASWFHIVRIRCCQITSAGSKSLTRLVKHPPVLLHSCCYLRAHLRPQKTFVQCAFECRVNTDWSAGLRSFTRTSSLRLSTIAHDTAIRNSGLVAQRLLEQLTTVTVALVEISVVLFHIFAHWLSLGNVCDSNSRIMLHKCFSRSSIWTSALSSRHE